MHRFLIADDHPLFREALIHVLGKMFTDLACTEVCSVEEALVAVSDDDYALILLDLYLPGVEGFSGLVSLRNRTPATPIVVVSAFDSAESVRQAMRLGAAGFLPKSSPKEIMASAIRLILSGGTYLPPEVLSDAQPHPRADQPDDDFCCLTRRQMMVLELLAEGKSNKEIARELDISQITAKAHISAILRKLRVSSRAQAIVAANRMKPSGMM